MIDSLLFLPDVVDVAADAGTDTRDAEAAAAVAATRDGHAHAMCAAWEPARAALDRSAAMRDALVAAGLAGPPVAARGWSDVATVLFARGDIDGARAALARVQAIAAVLGALPPDVGAAVAEIEAALDAEPRLSAPDAPRTVEPAGGLRWLDTTEIEGTDGEPTAEAPAEVPECIVPAPASRAAVSSPPAEPATRIAAVDDVVALAQAGRGAAAAPSGLRSRLRQLLRR